MTGFTSKRKMSISRMSDEVQQSPPSDDWGLNRAKGWRLKLCWLPKRCFLSKKSLWGKRAYHAVNIVTGPGDPIYVDYWLERSEFLFWNLKGR